MASVTFTRHCACMTEDHVERCAVSTARNEHQCHAARDDVCVPVPPPGNCDRALLAHHERTPASSNRLGQHDQSRRAVQAALVSRTGTPNFIDSVAEKRSLTHDLTEAAEGVGAGSEQLIRERHIELGRREIGAEAVGHNEGMSIIRSSSDHHHGLARRDDDNLARPASQFSVIHTRCATKGKQTAPGPRHRRNESRY